MYITIYISEMRSLCLFAGIREVSEIERRRSVASPALNRHTSSRPVGQKYHLMTTAADAMKNLHIAIDTGDVSVRMTGTHNPQFP